MGLMLRVRARWDGYQGAPGLSTFYFRKVTPPFVLADATTVAGRVRGAFDVYKTALNTSQTVLVDPTVDIIDDADGSLKGSFGITPPAVVTGTGIGATGPAEVQPGLILSTADIAEGRRVKGRSFLGPIIGSQTNVPLPTTALNNSLDAFGVALITVSPDTADPYCAVWHRPVITGGVVTRIGSSHRVLSATHATKFWVLRSRRD